MEALQYVSTPSTIATDTRPFWNKDYHNSVPYRHGLPRPLRVYRKSKVKPSYHATNVRSTPTTLNQIMETPGQSTSTTCAIGNAIQAPEMLYQNKCCSTTVPNALRLVRTKGYTDQKYAYDFRQYLTKRCKTFEQNSFNFTNMENNNLDKPGDPITLYNVYHANCLNNNCKDVYYKPRNYQFATQAGVSSNLRTFKLAVDTIQTNTYLNNFCNRGQKL
jgi:hypothetical protein